MEESQIANNKNEVKVGSTVYQIGLLREQIKQLKVHLVKNKDEHRKGNEKDIPAKRALLKKVAKLKIFLRYLKKKDFNSYQIESAKKN